MTTRTNIYLKCRTINVLITTAAYNVYNFKPTHRYNNDVNTELVGLDFVNRVQRWKDIFVSELLLKNLIGKVEE